MFEEKNEETDSCMKKNDSSVKDQYIDYKYAIACINECSGTWKSTEDGEGR